MMSGFGGPEVLQEQEIALAEVPAGHLLVRVRASSVNPVDTKIRRGLLAAIAPESGVLGCDLAGEVVLAKDAPDFSVGDAVYACGTGVKGCGGALAEFAVVDAQLCALKPKNLSWEEAAALPLVSITAWEALVDRAKLLPGTPTLIHAGTGGVGHIAVQLAVHLGAQVWSTVSSAAKASIVKNYGAEPIFYRQQSVTDYVAACTGGIGFGCILDTVGGENVAQCFAAAASSGTVCSISTRCTADLSPLHAKGLSLHVVFMLLPMLNGRGRAHHGEILRSVAALVENARLKPLVDASRFTFSQAAQAHAHLESGSALGKVVLSGF
jgi:NADPH2:quinone reductase